MTIKDEILEALRGGIPWAEIRANYRSKSQRYEALREYFLKAEEEIANKRSQLTQVEEDLQMYRMEAAESAERQAELASENEALSGEIAEKGRVLEEVDGRLTLLQEKGFSVEVLEKIAMLDSESGDKLLSQMVAFVDFKRLQKDVASRKRKKTLLEKSVEELREQKEEMEEKIRSEANRLDELIVRSMTYEDAVSTVLSLFEAGYSPDDLEALSEGFKVLGIVGDPRLSISRLVEGLRKMEKLHNLDEAISKKVRKLDVLSRKASAAKGELQALKRIVEDVEDVKKAGIAAINKTARHAQDKMDRSSERFDHHSSESTSELTTFIETSMRKVTTELSEWSDLNQQKGRIEEEIRYGEALMGILESSQYLQLVPPAIVVRLLERLLLWCELHIPELRVRPTQRISNQELNLNPYLSYKLVALIAFAAEGLRKHVLEQSRAQEGG